MKEIKNIILFGLGAVGSVYADKLSKYDCNFRVLVDESRLKKYTENPITYNNLPLNINYILPDEKDFKADLIIIATKMSGLNAAISQIKNFVINDTIILSLLNGVTSEQIIANIYGKEKVLYSYYIGHSAIREGNSITHDGINTLVFGSDNPNDNFKILAIKNLFEKANINFKIPDDIKRSLWLKFMLNVSSNPTTALFKMTFGEMQSNQSMMNLVTKIMKEVQTIAKAEGISNTDSMINEALNAIAKMSPEGKTSMLQDIEAGRATEIDTFAGTVIELGKKHNIETPYCMFLKDAFDIIHEQISKTI